MVRPGDLNAIISECFALPPATVELHNRNLREAGLRTKSPRGRGSGALKSDDAANLLIGILGSQSVKDSANTVKTYAPLKTNAAWDLKWFELNRLRSLDQHHCLADALVALIESASSGELLSAVEKLEGGVGTDLTQSSGPPFSIKFAISGPIPRAQIELTYFSMSDDGEIEIEAREVKEYYFTSKSSGLGVVSSLAYSDLSYEFRFTHNTIQRVGDLIGIGHNSIRE